MNSSGQIRIDEVSEHYESAKKAELIGKILFWIIAGCSLLIPYTSSLSFCASWKSSLQTLFIALVAVYFAISQFFRFYLVPKAERARRQQMLSNAFGTALSHETTALYYNNDYSPSVMRLGANTMENSLFGKETAAKMLIKSRIISGVYLTCWILAFASRHNNVELLTWITQLVFSGEIVAQWLNLEVLRFRHERTYEQLHAHFLHEVGEASPRATATILDAFVAYETAKSSAGLLLSTKVFNKINPSLTLKWEKIRSDLKMTD